MSSLTLLLSTSALGLLGGRGSVEDMLLSWASRGGWAGLKGTFPSGTGSWCRGHVPALCITSDAQGAVQYLGRMEETTAGSPADGCWHGKGSRDSLSLLLRFFQAQSPAGPLANAPHPPYLSHLSQSCSSISPWAADPRTWSQENLYTMRDPGEVQSHPAPTPRVQLPQKRQRAGRWD